MAGLPYLAGRNAEQFTHVHSEMTLVTESHFQSYLPDRQGSLSKEFRRAFDSSADQVPVYRLADGFVKQAFEMRHAQAGNLRDRTERQLLAEILLDKGQHVPKCARRHPSRTGFGYPGQRAVAPPSLVAKAVARLSM